MAIYMHAGRDPKIDLSGHGLQIPRARPPHPQPQPLSSPPTLHLTFALARRFYLPCNDGCCHSRFRISKAVGVGFRVRFACDLDVAVRFAVVGGIVLERRSVLDIPEGMTGLRGERRSRARKHGRMICVG